MTIIAEKMIFGGDCLAKVDGKAVLVSGALPGETVSVALTESHRDYDRARVTAILEPSPDRVEPQCELYGTCGGCSLMHCASKAQRQLRRQLLQDCFMREGIDCPPIATIAGPDFGYRSRFQFFDGGLRRRSSHECVMPSRCPIAESPINDWLEQVPPKERPTGRIQVFGSQYAGGALVIGTRATAHRQRAQTPRARFSGTVIDPQKVAVVTVAGARIAFDVRGFFQSNLFVLERAVNEICLP
ncbi:MAG: TRAM domain-containing protein, partial [Treponema sp.]|nr:TRAM domain-containing protein [Treponema sp.]